MNFKKSRNLMWIGFGIGFFVMALGIGLENEKITLSLMIVGTIIFLFALIQAFLFYHCPRCGYSLMNVRGEIPLHCPKCGEKLKEEK